MTEDTAKEQELRRRLLILFKNDAAMVDAYVVQFGTDINMKSIQAIREQFQASGSPAPVSAPAAPAAPAVAVPVARPVYPPAALVQPSFDANLESPIYSVVVDCPVCKLWSLNSYELKAKSLTIANDPFLAPVYESTGKFQPLNFLTASITICTRCLFASPDRKDFVVYNKLRRQSDPSQIPVPILAEMNDATPARLALRDSMGIGDELFKVPRNLAAAALSYQLADMRAAHEVTAGLPNAHFKRASYWIRIALLRRQGGMDDVSALESSLEHYQQAFMHSDFPTPSLEYQSLYVMFSIHLYLGRTKEARDYLAVLDKTRQELEKSNAPSAPANLNLIKKWIDMGRNRWEDREEARIWKTPGLG